MSSFRITQYCPLVRTGPVFRTRFGSPSCNLAGTFGKTTFHVGKPLLHFHDCWEEGRVWDLIHCAASPNLRVHGEKYTSHNLQRSSKEGCLSPTERAWTLLLKADGPSHPCIDAANPKTFPLRATRNIIVISEGTGVVNHHCLAVGGNLW